VAHVAQLVGLPQIGVLSGNPTLINKRPLAMLNQMAGPDYFWLAMPANLYKHNKTFGGIMS
jgi:hypothetical protein